MLDVLSKRSLFRFELPIRYLPKPPPVDGSLRAWDQSFLVPPLVELDDEAPYADVYWGWNEHGFHAAFDVPHRGGLPYCESPQWWKNDGVRLCIDTRDARDNKRATRFCHFFYILPVGGGSDGRAPQVGLHRMSRAKETPPNIELARVRIAAQVRARGYTLEVALPAACLHGWDPAEHNRIGVFYKIRDAQLGPQTLAASDESGWNVDPSTWATGVLVH